MPALPVCGPPILPTYAHLDIQVLFDLNAAECVALLSALIFKKKVRCTKGTM